MCMSHSQISSPSYSWILAVSSNEELNSWLTAFDSAGLLRSSPPGDPEEIKQDEDSVEESRSKKDEEIEKGSLSTSVRSHFSGTDIFRFPFSHTYVVFSFDEDPEPTEATLEEEEAVEEKDEEVVGEPPAPLQPISFNKVSRRCPFVRPLSWGRVMPRGLLCLASYDHSSR